LTWSSPSDINGVDTTSDTPWAISSSSTTDDPLVCIYFRGRSVVVCWALRTSCSVLIGFMGQI
jgi:hypothetical protein